MGQVKIRLNQYLQKQEVFSVFEGVWTGQKWIVAK